MRFGSLARYAAYGLLVLGTLEMAARVDDYFRDGASVLRPYTINTLFRPGPHGREGVPGERVGKWQMNSLGYRSPELVAGRINVLTFGASETFGTQEGPGREYPRVLERRLNDSKPGTFNVVNVAIPGIQVGRIGYLDRALEQTHARYVVVYPSPANYIGRTVPFCYQKSTPVAVPLGLVDHIRLAGKASERLKTLVPKGVLDPMRELANSLVIWRASSKDAPMARVPDATLMALREDLRCIVRSAQQRNAVLVLVTHATYFGDRLLPGDEAMMTAWRRFYPTLQAEGFLDLERRANEVIRSVATESKVPLVDAAIAIPRGSQYFADFVHFTDKGAAALGDMIAEAITSRTQERHSPQ